MGNNTTGPQAVAACAAARHRSLARNTAAHTSCVPGQRAAAAVDALQSCARPRLAQVCAAAKAVTQHLQVDEQLAAASPSCLTTRSAACVSEPATSFERHIMTHATADLRVLCVCTELSSSILVLEIQVEAAL